MMRKALIQYLNAQGCQLIREGGNHSWWGNRDQNRRSAILGHPEVKEILVKRICKDLGIGTP